jgi:hypothetical protein
MCVGEIPALLEFEIRVPPSRWQIVARRARGKTREELDFARARQPPGKNGPRPARTKARNEANKGWSALALQTPGKGGEFVSGNMPCSGVAACSRRHCTARNGGLLCGVSESARVNQRESDSIHVVIGGISLPMR